MRRVLMVLVVALALGGCGTAAPQSEPAAAPGPPGATGATGATDAVTPGAGTAGAGTAGAATAGAGNAGPGKAGPRHAAADVAFVKALLPHHQRGIALAREVAGRPEARTLAEAIIVTQQDEIVRMTGWLRDWGETPPSAAPGTSATASGADEAVRALIAHQEEAIKLAQQEQANGTNPTALAFARQVIESRAGEVGQLRGYLE